MRYDHFSMLPERAFQPRNGRCGGMALEGGGGGGTTQSTTYTSNIPEWLRPQTEALLGAATQEYFNVGADGQIQSIKPYTPYSTSPQDYIAGFSPLQRQAQYEVSGMQRPGQFGTATQFANIAGVGGLDTSQQAAGYGGAGYGSGMTGQNLGITGGGYYGNLGAQAGTMGSQLGTAGGQLYGGLGAGYGAQAAGLSPYAQQYGQTGADVGMLGLGAGQLGADVGAEARMYGRQSAGMGGLYEQMATDPRSVQAYMSPYVQNVIEQQKEGAIRDAQKTQLAQNLGAARTGTYGGARQLLATTERERALGSQLSNIEATGLQKAYEDAQRAQQFGVTTGLQGLQGAQAGLGTALQGGQLGLSGIGQAIAGQQAGLAGLGQAGQLYGLGMQGAQTGLSGIDRMLAGTAQGMQGAGLGLQGVQQQLAGTAQGMQGAGMGLQGVSGAQAGYGLTSQQAALLGQLGTQQQASDLSRLQAQYEMGAGQQAMEQAYINQAIQNYALAQQYPYQQLAAYSGLLRGYSTPTTSVSQYSAAPSFGSQAAGLGTAALGLTSLMKKEGGKIEEQGIDDLIIAKKLKKKGSK